MRIYILLLLLTLLGSAVGIQHYSNSLKSLSSSDENVRLTHKAKIPPLTDNIEESQSIHHRQLQKETYIEEDVQESNTDQASTVQVVLQEEEDEENQPIVNPTPQREEEEEEERPTFNQIPDIEEKDEEEQEHEHQEQPVSQEEIEEEMNEVYEEVEDEEITHVETPEELVEVEEQLQETQSEEEEVEQVEEESYPEVIIVSPEEELEIKDSEVVILEEEEEIDPNKIETEEVNYEYWPGENTEHVINPGETGYVNPSETEVEIYLPPIIFDNTEDVIDSSGLGYHAALVMDMFDDINPNQLANQLNESQSAAVKDKALHDYIKNKLNRSQSVVSPNTPSKSQILMIPISDKDIVGSGGNNNQPQALNQNLPLILAKPNRTIALTNWTGIPGVANYTEFNLTYSNNNTNLSFVLNLGAGFVVTQGMQAALLPDSNYNISAIYNVTQENNTNLTGLNASFDDLNKSAPIAPNVTYKIELQLQSSQNSTVNVSFLTSYVLEQKYWQTTSFSYGFLQDDNQTSVLVNWTNRTGNYTISTTNLTNIIQDSEMNSTSIELNMTQYLALGGYSLIQNLSTYQDADMMRYLMLIGGDYVIKQGIANGILANSTYSFSQINSVYVIEDPTRSANLYRYDIDITDNKTTNATMNYEVYYAIDSQVQTYSFYNSSINNINTTNS